MLAHLPRLDGAENKLYRYAQALAAASQRKPQRCLAPLAIRTQAHRIAGGSDKKHALERVACEATLARQPSEPATKCEATNTRVRDETCWDASAASEATTCANLLQMECAEMPEHALIP